MKRRGANLPGELDRVKRETALAMLKAYANHTPIDTGVAVSNYQISINSPGAEYKPAHVPGKYRSTASENIRATIALGETVLKSSKPGDSIHITNHIEYIGDLDNGTSTQAPVGMSVYAWHEAYRILSWSTVIKDS